MSGSIVFPNAVQDPSRRTLDRMPGSARRTSHIDMVPRGTTIEGLDVHAVARDLRTADDGGAEVLAEARLDAELGAMRVVRSLRTEPALPALESLTGRAVARGFRGALAELVPDELHAQTPLALLIDDLPVAVMVSGYVDSYVWEELPVDAASVRSDICAGWVHDGTMLTLTGETGYLPRPEGPEAPRLERDDDPLAWHEVPPLVPGAMRRRRLIDVCAAERGYAVHAMFRDTHVHEGVERILHEYALTAAVEDGRFTSCVATPRSLPWPECPSAAASATRVVGELVDDARAYVRTNLRGTSTCTHLNDLLCTLADVAPLIRSLTSPFSSR